MILKNQQHNHIEHGSARRRRVTGRVILPPGIALIAALCLSACGSTWPKGPFARLVLDRPLPTSDAERREECTWIGDEIGRQQDAWSRRLIFAEGREALVSRATLEQNLIVLESRAKAAHCND